MNKYEEFTKCLKIGQIFEKKAQAKLIEYHKNKYKLLHENDTFEYDFLLSNGKYYEVKYCSMINCNNTIFLETISNNKPSGINTTKANYYIFVIKQKSKNIFINNVSLLFIKIKVKHLIKIIEKNLFCNYYKDDLKQSFLIEIDTLKQ